MKRTFMLVALLMLVFSYIICTAGEGRTDTKVFDFESDEVGIEYLTGSFGTDLLDYWEITFDLYDIIGRQPATIKEENENKYLSVDAYLVAEYMDEMTDKYEVSFEMRTGKPEYLGGFFLHAADAMFKYFEWDNYKESGGRSTTTSQSFIGASGLIFVPIENALRIYVKTYENDGVHQNNPYGVGNEYVEFPLLFNTSSKFFKVTLAEENNLINISIDGEQVAVITLSDKGKYENTDYEYFKRVEIKDKEGNTLKSIDNSLVTVENKMIIGTRGMTHIDFDNISITRHGLKEEPTETPAENTPEITKKPEETKKPTQKNTEDKSPFLLVAVISFIAVVVILSIVFVILKKKKH
jgi:hypothetical protein